MSGGAIRSQLWMQIHTDVSNLPLTLTEVADAPALGSAILAAVGVGLFADIQTVAERVVKVTRVIKSDASTHSVYHPFYEGYNATYSVLRELRREVEV